MTLSTRVCTVCESAKVTENGMVAAAFTDKNRRRGAIS